MKTTLLACCLAPLLLAPPAQAGINGTYKVSGTEYNYGKKYFFNGTVKVSNYKAGEYVLRFNNGETSILNFKFSKRLKDKAASQKVDCSSSRGFGSATFRYVKGHYQVDFTYQASGFDVKGFGSGSK